MIQYLCCSMCGGDYKLHPMDVESGLKMRKVEGKAHRPKVHQIKVIVDGQEESVTDVPVLLCDLCNEVIPDGTQAVALTMWRGPEPDRWEGTYFKDL